MHTSSKRGFTLIELLVVIAIIGILSSVVLASLNNARQKSRDARRVSDVKQIQLALELYYDANASYPAGTSLSPLATTYIAAVPQDPQGSTTPYVYQALDSSSAACASAPCSSYVLRATLEDSAHSALNGDIDTDTGGVSCDAATEYCVRP